MKNSRRFWSGDERLERGLRKSWFPTLAEEAKEYRRVELWAKVAHRTMVRQGIRRDRYRSRCLCRGFVGE